MSHRGVTYKMKNRIGHQKVKYAVIYMVVVLNVRYLSHKIKRVFYVGVLWMN